MMTRALRALFAVAAPCAFACSQVIVVSGSGLALQNAILAAPDGAILVVPQNSSFLSVFVTVAKNVTVVAPLGATVDNFDVTFTGPYRLTVVGLSVSSPFGGELGTNGNLVAENCTAGRLLVNASAPVTVYVRNCWFAGGSVNRLDNVNAVRVDSHFAGYSSTIVGYDGLRVTGTGSLRAERTVFMGDAQMTVGIGLVVSTPAVLTNCTAAGGHGGLPTTQGVSIQSTSTVTLSNCSLVGPVIGTVTQRTVPSAAWLNRAWTVGGTSQVRFHENANRVVAVIAATDLVPLASPFASEPLYVGATSNWLVSSIGVTDGSGNLVATFSLPSAPALQYQSVWLTGAFVGSLPLSTSCPLGGVVY